MIEWDKLKGLNRIGLNVIAGDKLKGLIIIGVKLATCDRRR
jgi:hypothetical protein